MHGRKLESHNEMAEGALINGKVDAASDVSYL